MYKFIILRPTHKANTFIYGRDSLSILTNFFKKNKIFNFDPKKKIIYINFKILIDIIFNLSLDINSIKTSYLRSLIRFLESDLVVTLIDNDPNFWRLSLLMHNELRIISFQNGARYDLYSNPNKKEYFQSEYVCFGDHDKKVIQSINGKVKKYIPKGSIREVYYRSISKQYEDFKNHNSPKIYDICLIADNYAGWDKIYPGIEENGLLVAKYALKYAKHNNLSIAFAFKYKKNQKSAGDISELDFYRSRIDLEYRNLFFSYNDFQWTSRDIICKSNVTIGLSSTLLLESASRGNKVLICDYYNEKFSLGAKSPLALNDKERKYSLFSEKLDELLKISDQEYIYTRGNEVKRMINIKDGETISEFIQSVLESKLDE